MVTICGVEAESRAEKAGVQRGDVLLSINGHDIEDVLDYRFYLAERKVTLHLMRGEEPLTVEFHKDTYDDIGLVFETPLMDKKHSCANHCIFCFIDQLPKGLRQSLYFKDDDARLSFLHGNYITLTNLRDRDIDRIIHMHISPINVSVHTTNPELRCKMMGNRRAGKVLSYLKRLADAGIRLCCQIVLCRGINDGEELLNTMHDLYCLAPAVSSVSVVPAGLTRYREGLYPLEPFSKEEAAAVIDQVNRFGALAKSPEGDRIFCCSDEFYLKAELPLPDEEYYGAYEQLENGVGMLRSLITEFEDELAYLDEDYPEARNIKRTVSIATGKAAAPTLTMLAEKLEEQVKGLTVHVYTIENRFFGEKITVAGLLTGHDLAEQLQGKELGEALLISSNTLRAEGDLFLCGMSLETLKEKLQVPVLPTKNEGGALLKALLFGGAAL